MYRLHSRFASYANFCDGENFIALTRRPWPMGPCTIVVTPAVPIETVSSLRFDVHSVTLDGISLALHEKVLYRSALAFDPLATGEPTRVERAKGLLAAALMRQASTHDIVRILAEARGPVGDASFAGALFARLNQGIMQILAPGESSLLAGIAELRGVGQGLTPSGDDMIAGILFASHFVAHVTKSDQAPLRAAILAAARRDDPFVNHFVFMAGSGAALQPVKALLEGLMRGDAANVHRAVDSLATLGASSGIDLGVGLWVGIARHLTCS